MKKMSWVVAVLFVTCSCNDMRQQSTTDESNILHHNGALIRQYFTLVWNEGKTDALDTLLAAGYINHTPSVKGADSSIAGLKPIVSAIRKGIPDIHYEIKDMVVTKDHVVARLVVTGTHTDTLFGMPPTGRSFVINQINIEEIRNGRIINHWRVTDELEMMKQLGKFN